MKKITQKQVGALYVLELNKKINISKEEMQRLFGAVGQELEESVYDDFKKAVDHAFNNNLDECQKSVSLFLTKLPKRKLAI